VAFALREDRDQHIGTGHLFAPRGLDVNHSALDHTLEAGSRLGVVGTVGDQVFEFSFKIIDETGAQLVEIDTARTHHGSCVGIIDQRQQQVLQRRILMMTFVGDRECAMQGLFKALGKSRHSRPLWPPAIMIAVARTGNNNLCHI